MNRFVTELLQKEKLKEFWPTKYQTDRERTLAISRFIIYSGLIIAIYNQDITPVLVSLTIITTLFFLYNKKSKFVRSFLKKTCQEPTKNNPLSNRLPYDDVNRLSACDTDDVKSKITSNLFQQFPTQNLNTYNKHMMERQFFSMPNTGVINDQKEFASWLYGAPNKKMCKSNPEVCTGFQGMQN